MKTLTYAHTESGIFWRPLAAGAFGLAVVPSTELAWRIISLWRVDGPNQLTWDAVHVLATALQAGALVAGVWMLGRAIPAAGLCWKRWSVRIVAALLGFIRFYPDVPIVIARMRQDWLAFEWLEPFGRVEATAYYSNWVLETLLITAGIWFLGTIAGRTKIRGLAMGGTACMVVSLVMTIWIAGLYWASTQNWLSPANPEMWLLFRRLELLGSGLTWVSSALLLCFWLFLGFRALSYGRQSGI